MHTAHDGALPCPPPCQIQDAYSTRRSFALPTSLSNTGCIQHTTELCPAHLPVKYRMHTAHDGALPCPPPCQIQDAYSTRRSFALPTSLSNTGCIQHTTELCPAHLPVKYRMHTAHDGALPCPPPCQIQDAYSTRRSFALPTSLSNTGCIQHTTELCPAHLPVK